MSEMPRFENVDLTPTWDDVDPAELDFGGGALDPEPAGAFVTAAEVEQPDIEETDLELPPEVDHGDAGAGDIEAEAEADVELEAPSVAPPIEDEPADEFASLDDDAMQFADGPIGADTAPDDFDLS